jgi:hypothetical protein
MGPVLAQGVQCEQDQFPDCGGDCPPGSHCEAVANDAVVLPLPELPPEPDPPDCDQVLSHYVGVDVHALFPNGIDFSNPRHWCFRNVQVTTDPTTGDETETFDSLVQGTLDLGNGPQPAMLAGPVTLVVRGKGDNTTGSWDTEILSMSLTGDVGGVRVEIRENPDLPSPGQTTVTDLGGGQFQIDSFFDVFTELSVGGGPFEPQSNPPGRIRMRSAPSTRTAVRAFAHHRWWAGLASNAVLAPTSSTHAVPSRPSGRIWSPTTGHWWASTWTSTV